MIRAYQLEGGSILLVGAEDRPDWTIRLQFPQGGCPLRLAREYERIAESIRSTAQQMGATQERGL